MLVPADHPVLDSAIVERLLQQWKEIDKINKRAEDDFLILKGIECDILENGKMDLL